MFIFYGIPKFAPHQQSSLPPGSVLEKILTGGSTYFFGFLPTPKKRKYVPKSEPKNKSSSNSKKQKGHKNMTGGSHDISTAFAIRALRHGHHNKNVQTLNGNFNPTLYCTCKLSTLIGSLQRF